MLIHLVLILLGMLALSAFFSASETAFAFTRQAKPPHTTKAGGRINGLLDRMQEDPDRLFTTIRIGNHLANVAASCLATLIAFQTVPSHVVAATTGIMTVVILVFGEIIPKSLAPCSHLRIARVAIVPIYWFS